jgi:DUF4097 and DUF4098 domain-containing protein YvlB
MIAFALLLLISPKVEDRQTIQKTFPAPREVAVANVNGKVAVRGYDGKEVKATIERRVRADSKEKIEEAIRDVTLDMAERDGILTFSIKWSRGESSRGYQVTYDFDLQVPRATSLDVKTVNGPIHVADTGGKYNLKTVNGTIEMSGVSGTGDVHTVNGAVKAGYRTKPAAACSYKTVNGSVEATFPRDLAANLHFRTLHGGVYTDFPDAVLPAGSFTSGRSFDVRAGSGGPELKFETVNGRIVIRSAK